MRTIFRVLFILVICGSNAHAGRSVPAFISGNWEGHAYYGDDGTFGFCSIFTSYQSGISVMFALHPDGVWKVSFGQRGGFSSSVGRYLTLYVDGQYLYGAPADSNNEFLILTLPSTFDLFTRLRIGHRLKVVTPGGSAIFSLTGTAAAFLEMWDCVKRHAGPAVARAPQGLQSTDESSQAPNINDRHRITREQALTYAANLLAAANISGYEFLPHEETKQLGDAVWRLGENGMGALMVLRNLTEPVDIDQLTANASKDDSVACKGDFVSGKKALKKDRSVSISKSFSSCKAAGNSFYYEYSWIDLPKGTFVRLVHGVVGTDASTATQDSSRLADRTEEAILRVSFPR